MYAAQEIPQIDAEIAQKGHSRMETNYKSAGCQQDYAEASGGIPSNYAPGQFFQQWFHGTGRSWIEPSFFHALTGLSFPALCRNKR